jgi:predicted unusual protein kinase regulating ubiquinone biosynthesis (AarF/ABC1/UbiB family)
MPTARHTHDFDSAPLVWAQLARVQIGEVLQRVLQLVRQHHVRIESNFTNLVMGIVVLEGLGRRLDPNLDIFQTALPILRHAHEDYRGQARTYAAHAHHVRVRPCTTEPVCVWGWVCGPPVGSAC